MELNQFLTILFMGLTLPSEILIEPRNCTSGYYQEEELISGPVDTLVKRQDQFVAQAE